MTVQEDLDYVEDIVLLSSNHQDAQQKAARLCKSANFICLKINT